MLIADESRAAIHRSGVDAPSLEVRFGPRDEQGTGLIQGIQAFEVQIGAIHHIEGARLGQQDVQHIDVVQLAVRDEDEGWNRAAQVEERMQFYRGLGVAKRRPGKQRQAQVDGRRVQCIDRVVQFDGQGFLGVQASGDADQRLGKLAVDAPIPCLVGIPQIAARDIASDTQMVELGRLRA